MSQVYFYPQRRSFFGSLSVTMKLIIFNVFIYIVSLFVLSLYGESFFSNYLALTPSLILQGNSLWTFITSIFMHASFFHLFANMFSLFFVGGFLERIIGRKRFFWVYMAAGLLGGIFYVAGAYLFGGLTIPAVGASGAIFGLIGVLAVLVPFTRIYLIIGPLVVLIAQVVLGGFLPGYANAIYLFGNVLIILMIFSLFSFRSSFRKIALPLGLPMWLLPVIAIVPLILIDLVPGIDLPIGNSAHIGGLVVGLVYGLFLRKKFPNKIRRLGKRFR